MSVHATVRWLAAILGAAVLGCGAAPEPSGAPLRTVATIPAAAHWLRALGGDLVEVNLLLPPGASPHHWQPSMRDMRALADADLCLFVGGGLEPWMDRILDAAGGARRDVSMFDLLPDEARLSLGDEHGFDPHIWLSPTRARIVCRALTQTLTEIAPEHAAALTTRGDEYQARLAALEEEFAQRRAQWAGRRIITAHRAWGYFASDLGLDIAAVIERAVGVEPSPVAMRVLMDLAEREEVAAIVIEPQVSAAVARRLADAVSIATVTLDPMGPSDQTWEELMRANLAALDAALP